MSGYITIKMPILFITENIIKSTICSQEIFGCKLHPWDLGKFCSHQCHLDMLGILRFFIIFIARVISLVLCSTDLSDHHDYNLLASDNSSAVFNIDDKPEKSSRLSLYKYPVIVCNICSIVYSI